MTQFTGIFSALQSRPHSDPDQLTFSFANEHGQIEQALNWQQLAARIDSMTGFLRTHCNLNSGDRVLLVYPPSIDFVLAFAGCLRAGLVPVPVYPPNPRKFDSGMQAFQRIARDCDARIVLTSEQYERNRNRGGLQELAQREPDQWSLTPEWVITDHVHEGNHAPVYGPEPAADDIALIQYTSGSTSAPKGVVITHGNLAHQIECARVALNIGPDSRAVFWVPQYHDLGLIGGIMNALAGNMQVTLFSPFSFIKRPALWFELMHKLKATHTAGPNFAYDLAVQKTTPEQRAQWDLSSLQVMMSAAEPVRASTQRAFVEAFAASGLNPRAYLPAYGLAEHTVGVTYNGGTINGFDREQLEHHQTVVPVTAQSAQRIELVSSGTCQRDVQLKIVDGETLLPCADNRVGEIWVDSPSKAAGYWKLQQENIHAFNATLADGTSGQYLRTGDLGFMFGGELYICGRMKDLLILAGRNVYPQDIEDSVLKIDDTIKPVAMAAFAVEIDNGGNTEEKLVLLVDIRNLKATAQQMEQLAQKIQRAVLDDHQIPCHAIVVAPVGTVLKTTSGKVRRQACRQAWLDGTLESRALFVLKSGRRCSSTTAGTRPSAALTSATGPQAHMQQLAAQLLNLPDAQAIDLQIPLTEQGMGSLVAVEFCHQYELASGTELSITDFFNHPSISELCEALASRAESAATLDQLFAHNPGAAVKELHALRHHLLHNRLGRGGFRIGEWSVRAAIRDDVAAIHRLDQAEYGWLGEDATDDADFILHQVETLNYYAGSTATPWFWLLEKSVHGDARARAEIVGWYIMLPTHKSPASITSWADATDHGRLSGSFDPQGKNLYLVAGGVSREHTKQAHRLMVLNALSLMALHGMSSVFACLAMPGFIAAQAMEGFGPEQYMQLTHSNGMPRDAFLAFFRELWSGEHRPLRLLRDGYPPDRHSGGHGVCACVDVFPHRAAMARVFDKLAQQRTALFPASYRGAIDNDLVLAEANNR